MLPAHYNPKMSSPPNPWLEDVTGSSMAKCDNLNPHYNVMTSLSPSASSLNVSQQNWDRQFQLYFNGIYNVSHIIHTAQEKIIMSNKLGGIGLNRNKLK